MNVIDNDAFAVPCIGVDSVTKGQFTILSAYMVWDEDAEDMVSMAQGEFNIKGLSNPLYQIAKRSPLRLQGLVASVMFGIEKRFIKFDNIKYFEIVENDHTAEIDMTVTFQILSDNLEYLEDIIEYKDENHL